MLLARQDEYLLRGYGIEDGSIFGMNEGAVAQLLMLQLIASRYASGSAVKKSWPRYGGGQ